MAAAALTGCDDDTHHQRFDRKAYVRISDQVTPVSAGKVLGDQSSSPADDAIAPAPAQDQDPLASNSPDSSSDPIDGGDPLVTGSTHGTENPNRAIKNWYWLRGNINGGSIAVRINGIFIQQFSVNVDTEISNYLHPGGNEITFAPQPTVAEMPVSCHLDIVYSQQAEGSLPVATYDTTDTSSHALSQATTVSSSPENSNADGIQTSGNPPVSPWSQNNSAQSPMPVTMEFDAS